MQIFTEKELQLRNKGLQEIKQIFSQIDIPFFLVGGVLLGAVREKNFIKWDWDVEVSVFSEIAIQYADKIIDISKGLDFEATIVNPTLENFKIKLIKYDNKYTIEGLYLKNNYRLRKEYKYPSKYFDNFDVIHFLGEDYLSPTPINDFLTFVYGPDWMIPKKTLIKEEYIAKNHFNRSYFSNFKNYIKKIIR